MRQLSETLDDASNYDELLAAIKCDPVAPYAYVRAGDATTSSTLK